MDQRNKPQQHNRDGHHHLPAVHGSAPGGIQQIDTGLVVGLRHCFISRNLFPLWNQQLCKQDSSRCCHDICGKHVVNLCPHTGVDNRHACANGGHANHHDLKELSFGHVFYVGRNRHGPLHLADKDVACHHCCFRSGQTEQPPEEPGHSPNHPLHDPQIVEQVDQHSKKDNLHQCLQHKDVARSLESGNSAEAAEQRSKDEPDPFIGKFHDLEQPRTQHPEDHLANRGVQYQKGKQQVEAQGRSNRPPADILA